MEVVASPNPIYQFQKTKVQAVALFAGGQEVTFVDPVLPCKIPKLPAIGSQVFGASAVVRLLAQNLGLGAFELAQIDEWMEHASRHLEAPSVCASSAVLGHALPDASAEEQVSVAKAAKLDLIAQLAFVESVLAKQTFLVRDQLGVADIVVASTIYQAFSSLDLAGQLPHTARFVCTVLERKDLFPGVGDFKLCTETGEDYSKLARPVHMVMPSMPQTGTLFKRSRTRVRELLSKGESAIGSFVTVCGWARSVRSDQFVDLNDGSCSGALQVVFTEQHLGADGVDKIKRAGGTGASFQFEGIVVKSVGNQAIELRATFVRVLGINADPAKYPLAKKGQQKSGVQAHTVEHLREVMHLRARTRLISGVARVRHVCAMATHRFFDARGFAYVHTPILTAADCEGAGQMFQVTTLLERPEGLPKLDSKHPLVKKGLAKAGDVNYQEDFFGKPAFLTVSGQLNVECFATALSDVYTFGPTFRAENSNTSRHLAEFWMIEPEMCFATLQDDMDLVEDFVKHITREVLELCREDLEMFDKTVEAGLIKRLENVLEAPFERLTYRRAIAILNEHIASGQASHFEEKDLHFGTDLASEHERYLTERVFKKPVILTNYPAGIKAFYMKRSEEDPETVEAMDVLVPQIGELVGGSARETDFALLESKMKAMGLENEWYMDLRKYGSVPHAGFGVGFERLVMFVTGMTNIRDVIPFPRFPKNVEF